MPPKGERRKNQIINTAKEMFIENGFQSTHIGQVCENLCIARGTVYQYFSNKKEIIYAILDGVIEAIEDILDPDDIRDFLANDPSEKSIKKFINDRISGTISVLVNEPIVIKLIFKEIAGIDEEIINRVNRTVGRIAKIIALEVDEIKKLNLYKTEINSRLTASMLVGGIMLIVYDYEKRGMNVLDESVVEGIANNYLTGVMR
jgi:AcrR family transcriptional regulator